MNAAIKIRHPKKRAFLAAYSECAQVSRAAKAAEIDRSTHYDWLETDESYLAAFQRAEKQAGDLLEEEAVRRAYEGIEKPVTIAGEREIIREYADTLLIFLLKGIKPERYRDRAMFEHTGKDGAALFPAAALESWIKGGANADQP